MSTLYQLTQTQIPAGGISIPLGLGLRFWLSIAVDPIANQSSGTNVVVTVSKRKGARETLAVNYGAPALKRQFDGNLVVITGTGATIELWMATEEVTVTPVTLPATSAVDVSVQGTVDMNLKEVAAVAVPTVSGGIPIEDGGGGGELAGVTASGEVKSQPTGGDLTSGSLKSTQLSSQLPSALDSGFFQVAVKKPLSTPGGYVEVYSEPAP